jgi:hypothetical protein
MFTDHPRCEQLADKIYVFRNIVPKEIISQVRSELDAYDKKTINDIWSIREWYSDKVTAPLMSSFPLWEFMSELMYPELVIHPQRSMLLTNKDDEGMFVHADSPGKGRCDLLTEIDTWQTCCELEYGVVAYFGEFAGGSLFYPNINPDGSVKENLDIYWGKTNEPCFEVKVQEGDIVFHSATSPYEHGVRKVDSGRRYAFSCFALLAEDNPGTFYNYKTPEYYNQIGNKTDQELSLWNSPFENNPQFKDIIEEKRKIIELNTVAKSASAR